MFVKYDVAYELDNNLRREISVLNKHINSFLLNSEIFLFGSIAKGMYTKDSDIDLLILIKENKSLKELRQMRHFVEDEIEKLELKHEVDIKMYSKDRYLQLVCKPSFEQAIVKDLISLKEWNYGT